MTVLVDTSVWSLALRRDAVQEQAEVQALSRMVTGTESIVTTGFVLQELLQGFQGARAAAAIVSRFQALPMLNADRQDHIAAADIRNICRRAGVQIGTIDALLIQLCVRYELTLLTTDQDFQHARLHVAFKLWGQA